VHVHAPAEHVAPDGQAFPHSPQLATSVCVSTQDAPQAVRVVSLHAHALLLHAASAGQALPHLPQFVASFATQAPVQRSCPVSQVTVVLVVDVPLVPPVPTTPPVPNPEVVLALFPPLFEVVLVLALVPPELAPPTLDPPPKPEESMLSADAQAFTKTATPESRPITEDARRSCDVIVRRYSGPATSSHVRDHRHCVGRFEYAHASSLNAARTTRTNDAPAAKTGTLPQPFTWRTHPPNSQRAKRTEPFRST
jgi:hypothetical protein